MHLHTGADLKALTEQVLSNYFGKSGKFYYRIVRGIDERPVQPFRETKSLAAEDTFEHDLVSLMEMHTELKKLAEKISTRLEKHNLRGRTVTLKLKFNDFKQITRNLSLQEQIFSFEDIFLIASRLLDNVDLIDKSVRLLGISISNFNEISIQHPRGDPYQLLLFE